jgi:hypothetical protein
MTIQRKHKGGTPFTEWIRNEEPRLDSSLSYNATDIDLIWEHKNTDNWMIFTEVMEMPEWQMYDDDEEDGEFMLCEEKTGFSKLSKSQERIILRIDRLCQADPMYRGRHLIRFENTKPTDGKIWVDEKEVSYEQFICFLEFKEFRTKEFEDKLRIKKLRNETKRN